MVTFILQRIGSRCVTIWRSRCCPSSSSSCRRATSSTPTSPTSPPPAARSRGRGRGAAPALRPRPADLGPVLQVDGRVASAISACRWNGAARSLEVIGDRLWLTMLISFGRADPDLGHRAADRHLLGGAPVLVADYVFTFIGFIGLAMPNFLLALVIMYFGFTLFRRQHRRAVLRRVRARALVLGQGLGPDRSTCRCRR
jgi:hypothetical protein